MERVQGSVYALPLPCAHNKAIRIHGMISNCV